MQFEQFRIARRAMGTTAEVIIVTAERHRCMAPQIAEHAHQQIDRLERLWSRFITTSEVERVNRHAGNAELVSAETLQLFRAAIAGHAETGGRFDPSVLRSLQQLGYDHPFATITHWPSPSNTQPAPGCNSIEVDVNQSTVRVPHGVAFDPGGIGKGLAADIVAQSVMRQEAVGVCVNIGGDLCVSGHAPEGRGWSVSVENPIDTTATSTVLWLSRGAVATSATNRRRWICADGTEQHHLIDPATGNPADTHWSAITVIAGSACRAEVLATAGMVAGADAIDMFSTLNVDALLIDPAGIITAVGNAASFLA